LKNNVVKHADATELSIQVMKSKKGISISVEDNGVGFDYKSAIQKSSFGLKSVKARIERLNGKLNPSTSVGHGTCMMIDIPV